MARTLDDIAARLAARPPELDTEAVRMAASVALVLRERDGDIEALFIRRAEHDGDPWSGDLAFPGGRIDPEDVDARAAAERETLEELALDISGASGARRQGGRGGGRREGRRRNGSRNAP